MSLTGQPFPFQPTLPARGATGGQGCPPGFTRHFNPRSPHGERLIQQQICGLPVGSFQPTLPARGATGFANHSGCSNIFQPTLPARGATENREATRNGSWHFNPRSPHGERPLFVSFLQICAGFQPTLPARGATFATASAPPTAFDFNPRSPHGERLDMADDIEELSDISTHAPRTGSDF